MYHIFFLLLILASFFIVIFHYRRKKIIHKIQSMEKPEKCTLLDELIRSFGYRYQCCSEFFSSTLDAWQKKAGYTYFYDYMAPRFQMVYDTLPVYFNYKGKTWLIQFWKGQYGINTGAEIGIYRTDQIIPPEEYKTTLFNGVEESEMLPLSFRLSDNHNNAVYITQKHWWLTSFWVGHFSNPQDLITENTLHFPNTEMLTSFVEGLIQAGIPPRNISVCGLCVSFYFCDSDNERHNLSTRFWRCFSQWKNKLFCKLYLSVTKPFCNTEDRILYLYYFLPFAFRKLLRLHRFNKRCHRKKRCIQKCYAQKNDFENTSPR